MKAFIQQQTVSFESLYLAYKDCRKRKRGTANAQRYDMQLLDKLFATQGALNTRSYSPSRSIRFVAQKPKAREIHAADFQDRVVHHWLVPQLERLFEPVFIHDVYSNRKGKGIHKAVKRLQAFMHQIVGSGDDCMDATAWYLQLDIKNFFNTIDCPVLFKLIQHRLKKSIKQQKISKEGAATLRWLCHVLLKHDTTENAIYRGDPALLNRVPAYKQLGNGGNTKGLPIGNLTSQFFANVYMNPFDQFVKHTLKCKHYLRYVDDFVLLSDSPRQLLRWREQMQTFLHNELQLELKELAEPKRISSGINFLGYIIYPHHRLVRRRVVGNLREKLLHFQRQLIQGTCQYGQRLCLNDAIYDDLRATLASYWGHFKHANHYRLIGQLGQKFPWLTLLFHGVGWGDDRNPSDDAQRKAMLIPKWKPDPADIVGYRTQVLFFQQQFPYSRLSVQRGMEVDIFYPSSPLVGVPLSPQPTACVSHIIIRENGYLKGGLKRRQISKLFIKPGVELCPTQGKS